MPGEQQDYKAFRQRLDAVLRQRDPDALRAFLVAEGQWQADAPTDAEASMWMMIAASPALKDLRGDAERWLVTHGHEAEAGAILGARRSGGASGHERPRGQRPDGQRPRGTGKPLAGGAGKRRTGQPAKPPSRRSAGKQGNASDREQQRGRRST